MEGDSDNKVKEHLCSQKMVLFSANAAKKSLILLSPCFIRYTSSAAHHGGTSDDPWAVQPHGNSLGWEIIIRNANEMHVKVLRF